MFKYGVISGPNREKYGPEITPYLDTFHAVKQKIIVPLRDRMPEGCRFTTRREFTFNH